MRKKLCAMSFLFFTTTAFARPEGFYLVTPKKLELKNGTKLVVTFELPCKNTYADDWSEVVMSSDDSGDREVAVGVVAAMSSCTEKGTSEYTKIVDLKKEGRSSEEDESTFYPMSLK